MYLLYISILQFNDIYEKVMYIWIVIAKWHICFTNMQYIQNNLRDTNSKEITTYSYDLIVYVEKYQQLCAIGGTFD